MVLLNIKNKYFWIEYFSYIFLLTLLISTGCCIAYADNDITQYKQNFTQSEQIAKKYGTHEIILKSDKNYKNPLDIDCKIQFTPPSGAINNIKVNAFYDGEKTWRARIYIRETGKYHWKSISESSDELDNRSGFFNSVKSNLRGVLKLHPGNSKYWMTDNGDWFLNISDTGYLLFNNKSDNWKKYVQEDWELGITSIRVGGLGGFEWDDKSSWWGEIKDKLKRIVMEASKLQKIANTLNYSNSPWIEDIKNELDLEKFKTTDKRLIWMLNNYPDLYIQIIVFGLKNWETDDTGKEWKKIDPLLRQKTMSYMIARWAAFPQIFWLVVNDIHCCEKYPNNKEFVHDVGTYLSKNDPWKHPISVGLNRKAKFLDVDKNENKWITYIHLEDEYQLDAEIIKNYDSKDIPVFLAEDRYEQDYFTKDPLYPRYYYRCLFWSWLLSGGSANYGGRWRYLHAYSETENIPYFTNSFLEQDRHIYNKRLKGLDTIVYIKKFFDEQKIDLWRFHRNNNRVKDLNKSSNKRDPKLMENGHNEFIIYYPNSEKIGRNTKLLKNDGIKLDVDLTDTRSVYNAIWYNPSNGEYFGNNRIIGGKVITLVSPVKGYDMVLLLKKSF